MTPMWDQSGTCIILKWDIWVLRCLKQVSRALISKYTPQYMPLIWILCGAIITRSFLHKIPWVYDSSSIGTRYVSLFLWVSSMFFNGNHTRHIWGHWCQTQASQAGISNYILEFTVGCNYLTLPSIASSGTQVLISKTGVVHLPHAYMQSFTTELSFIWYHISDSLALDVQHDVKALMWW